MAISSMVLRPAAARGRADLAWLRSQHSFSFGEYVDRQHMGFSDLLVLNEDEVAPAQGFPTHGHRDMEIFSYVLSGALAHRDSMGHGSVLVAGEVQLMRAGTGIRHSEYNASADQALHFLQIWIVPSANRLSPDYQQKRLDPAAWRGQALLVLAPPGQGGVLTVQQDAKVFLVGLDGTEQVQLDWAQPRFVYVHLARGQVQVNGQPLQAGDGLYCRYPEQLRLTHGVNAEVLLFDLRPQERS